MPRSTCYLPDVVLTPYIGYVTGNGYRLFCRETVEDSGSWLRGVPERVISSPA